MSEPGADQMSVWKLEADLGRRSARGLQHDQRRPNEAAKEFIAR